MEIRLTESPVKPAAAYSRITIDATPTARSGTILTQPRPIEPATPWRCVFVVATASGRDFRIDQF